MKSYKLSLGKNYFNVQEYAQMIKDGVVAVNSNTKAKGKADKTQYESFLEAEEGDIFFLCHSNETIDLIGMFSDNSLVKYDKLGKNEGWKYRKFITLYEAKNNKGYDKNFTGENGKKPWWHPGDNSTFIKIKDMQLFEKEILKPVFNVSLEELSDKVKGKR